eukprot:430795_1
MDSTNKCFKLKNIYCYIEPHSQSIPFTETAIAGGNSNMNAHNNSIGAINGNNSMSNNIFDVINDPINSTNTINETAVAGGNDKEEMDTDEPNEMINMEEDDNNTGALDSSIIQFIPPKSDWDIGTNYIEKSTVNDI